MMNYKIVVYNLSNLIWTCCMKKLRQKMLLMRQKENV
nr:MAG TPA: hypothetical protein [Caudoviricetes sp.]